MQPTTHEMQDIEARHLTAVVWFAEKFQPLLFSFFFFLVLVFWKEKFAVCFFPQNSKKTA